MVRNILEVAQTRSQIIWRDVLREANESANSIATKARLGMLLDD